MEDPAAITIGGVAASVLISMLVQKLKDYAPNLGGRAALAATDLIALVVAFVAAYFTTPDFRDSWLYVNTVMFAFAYSVIAQGHYRGMRR